MTNKINGIDVSECKYKFQDKDKFDGKEYCTLHNELCENISFVCDKNCQVYEDYKQLKRLQEENKRLQMLSCANCGEKYLSPDGLELYEKNVRLEQQIEAYQLSENEAKEIIAELTHKNKELKEENKINELKKEVTSKIYEVVNHIKIKSLNEEKINKYKQALEEIKEMLIICCDRDYCKGCEYYDKCFNGTSVPDIDLVMINKINEVLNDN